MNSAVTSTHRQVWPTAGVLYVLTFVSIPTLARYGPVKGANDVLDSEPDTAVIIGGILEIVLALAGHRHRRDPVPDSQAAHGLPPRKAPIRSPGSLWSPARICHPSYVTPVAS